VTAQAPDVLVNDHPRVRLDGLRLYWVARGDRSLNYGWGIKYEFLSQADPGVSTVRATHLHRGYVAEFRLGPDGELVLEEYRYPTPSFRDWRRQAVGERLTGDFWLVMKPDFLGQRVYIPFLAGRIVEDKKAWVIEPYQPWMRGPPDFLEGLDAFMAASRARDEAVQSELARLRERDPLTIPVAELELWPSAYYPLYRAGLETLGELSSRTAGELMRDIGLTERAVGEVREALADFGLKLKGE
jgi:hypothetical protein